jgi:hypothetical protein
MDIAKILAEARALLDFELQREIWTLPTKKAERMEAYEARYDLLVAKLVAQARQHVGSGAPAAEQEQQSATVSTAPTVAAPAATAPAATPAPESEQLLAATDGDLVDEFDTPAF